MRKGIFRTKCNEGMCKAVIKTQFVLIFKYVDKDYDEDQEQ